MTPPTLYPRNEDELKIYLRDGHEVIFPEQGSFPIRASVIRDLIEEGAIKQPVRIRNADIEGKLDLRYTQFQSEVSFVNTRFRLRPDFSFATFQRAAGFDHCHFPEGADFRSATATHDFRICCATFKGQCSFMDFHASGVFRAEGVSFEKYVTFEQATFDRRALFCPPDLADNPAERRQSRFGGPANFDDARFKGAAHFEGAAFFGNAYFRRVTIESSANFQCFKDDGDGDGEAAFFPTNFGRNVSFNAARFQGTAYFRGVNFNGLADFERAHFGGHALFQPSETTQGLGVLPVRFGGKALFRSAYVGGNAEFFGACFEAEAVFERIEVKHNAYFRSFRRKGESEVRTTEFHGPVSFLGGRIGGHAEFQGAVFAGTYLSEDMQFKADFEGLTVEGIAFFNQELYGEPVGHVRFRLPVVFRDARVNGQTLFPKAEFSEDANFTNFRAGGSADFSEAVFHQDVKFVSAHFTHQVNFADAKFKAPTPPDPPDGDPSRRDSQVKGADFTDVKMDGAATFRKAEFVAPKVSFRAARFKTLDLSGATYVQRKFCFKKAKKNGDRQVWAGFWHGKRRWYALHAEGNLDLSGATYDNITADINSLLLSLDPYDRFSYTALEKSQRAVGRDREADDILYDGFCRTGLELWEAWGKKGRQQPRPNFIERHREWPRAAFFEVRRKLFRFGVRPYRLLFLTIGVLILGALVFSRSGAQMHKDVRLRESVPSARAATLPHGINMSFRQFIPIVEIPPGSDWLPSDNEFFLGFSYAGYATFHRLFGFILIPLGVASLTGLLKPRDRK